MTVEDGTLEGLKWLALVLMLLDHTNKFLFTEQLPVVFEAARVTMPLFGFVLAYNLSRPGTAGAAYLRTMKRLLVFGVLASPMFIAMVGWWPMNIMFTLLLSVALMYLLDRGGAWHTAGAAFLFVLAGAVVEFWWPAVLVCVMAWAYCRQPTAARLVVWILATAALGLVNRNLWALAVFPIIFAAPHLRLVVPRRQYAFYAFYPLHLAVLWISQRVMP